MQPLRLVMFLNGLSCLGFGLLFMAMGGTVAAFLGVEISWLLPALGVVLALNGAHLFVASRRPRLLVPEVLYFSAGDFAWVLASIAIVAGDWLVVTSPGQLATLLVAAVVMLFGLLQIMGVRRLRRTRTIPS